MSQAVEKGKGHGELASPSELLLVKLAAGSSWTLQDDGSTRFRLAVLA